MRSKKLNLYLLLGAALTATAALLHLGCIFFGAPWYRFFGAGEQMAQMAERGDPVAALLTATIALVLAVWSIYAFAAAGLFSALPGTRWILSGITAIYLLRGFAGLWLMGSPMGRSPEFWLWSSLICLGLGSLHAIGLWQQWRQF